ncbi:hypothetical protein TNCV_386631 [Trichonephila clavipes]|nr:hypothetical protein TNCV_386631 [Trichonephila clavipes]
MYKNNLKEDLIRVVENLDGTVESTDTIVKLKTKIENSSTFESDPDFVKTLIQNCIDERVSRNERESLSVPSLFVCFRFSGLHGSTAADSTVRLAGYSGSNNSQDNSTQSSRAGALN